MNSELGGFRYMSIFCCGGGGGGGAGIEDEPNELRGLYLRVCVCVCVGGGDGEHSGLRGLYLCVCWGGGEVRVNPVSSEACICVCVSSGGVGVEGGGGDLRVNPASSEARVLRFQACRRVCVQGVRLGSGAEGLGLHQPDEVHHRAGRPRQPQPAPHGPGGPRLAHRGRRLQPQHALLPAQHPVHERWHGGPAQPHHLRGQPRWRRR